jgi:hypothetical protein
VEGLHYKERAVKSLLGFLAGIILIFGLAYGLVHAEDFLRTHELTGWVFLLIGVLLMTTGYCFWWRFLKARHDIVYTATGFKVVNRKHLDEEEVFNIANLKRFSIETSGDEIRFVDLRFADGRRFRLRPRRYQGGRNLVKKIREQLN